MRLTGIQGRLLLILAMAALAVMIASLAALRALDDISGAAESVTGRDLPAATAAMRLARIAERLQQRGASLMAAGEPAAREREQKAVEEDLAAFAGQLEVLRSARGETRSEVEQISALSERLAGSLRDLRARLDWRARLTALLEREQAAMLAGQDRIRQIIGPSILAVAAIVDGGPTADPVIYRTAVRSQAPLLSAERLVNSAIADLLLAASATTTDGVTETRAQYARTRTQLDLVAGALPAGLRHEFRVALAGFARQGGPDGVFALRLAALATHVSAEGALDEARVLAGGLKSAVDRLVLTANQSMADVTERLSGTIVTRTEQFIAVGIAVILLTTGLAFAFVIRPLGRNLAGVTEAMTRLAHGERDAQVPGAERHDEIGDLARAFTVFKDNVFRMDVLDRELAEKSSLLLATFDTMNDGFTVFDAERRLVAWNPHYLTLYGFSGDDVTIGTPITEINRRLEARGVTVSMPGGEPTTFEELSERRLRMTQRYELHFPGGRIVELRSNPIPRGGFVTIHMDVTEQRATESQLRQAQKMETVGQLTGGIAHDFNNILAVILGNLFILERELADDPKLLERTRKALGAAERAAGQVNRLLAFSRRQKLAPEDVDVNALVAGMMDLIDASLGSGVVLRTDFAPDLPVVHVDPGQLENALMNLAVNARDAMDGRGEIVFTTRPADGPFIEIAVTDTGQGIPPDLIDQVFEPFFTTKATGKGSGLGLSMVYGFVKQSGGTVALDSAPGAGTTVTLRLPVAAPTGAVIAQGTGGQAATRGGEGECLLVVDDDADLLELTAGQLSGRGYRVVSAGDGETALRLLAENPDIRLLYTDVVMPGRYDGVALAEEARKRRPDLVVLFTSAEPGKAGIAAADLLRKPVAEERLVGAVRERLGGGEVSSSR